MTFSSPRDDNRIPALFCVSDADGVTPIAPQVNATTKRLKVSAIITSGGDITSLNGLVDGIQTFSSVSDTNVTLGISSVSPNHAFTLGWSGILAASRGGTANGFFQVSGPAASAKTYTFPNANCSVLTDNAAVSIAQGGTGATTAPNALTALGAAASGVNNDITALKGIVASDLGNADVTLDFTNTHAGKVTNITTDGTITATTFSGSLSGNASTVTNATLTTALTVDTGTVQLTGNAANTSHLTLGAGASSVSGTNTGDQTTISGNAGSATILQTTRAIYGNNFDGSAALTQVIASTYGGTGNGFTKFTGPTSTEKTFTLPDVSATLLPILTGNTTKTVKTSGGDFTTIQAAFDWANGYAISGSATLTIEVDDGVWSSGATLTCAHPNGSQIKVVGKNTYTTTINSIQSVGSRTAEAATYGNIYYRDYVLNVSSVANIASGDYVLIRNTTGGYQALHLQGCHRVTNVDGGNIRITVRVFNLSPRAASGSVTTTSCTIVKTVITCSDNTKNIIDINGTSLQLLDKCVVTYGAAVYGAGGISTLKLRGGASLIAGSQLGVTGGGDGTILVDGDSYLEFSSLCVSAGSYDGIASVGGSRITSPTSSTTVGLIVNGCFHSGMAAEDVASFRSLYAQCLGNDVGAESNNGGNLVCNGGNIIGNNTYGLYANSTGALTTSSAGIISGNKVDYQSISGGTLGSGGFDSNTHTGGVTHTNTTIEMTSTEYIEVGMAISGTDIPAGTTISAVSTDQVTCTLSQAATGSHSGITFTLTTIGNLVVNTLNTSTGAIITG